MTWPGSYWFWGALFLTVLTVMAFQSVQEVGWLRTVAAMLCGLAIGLLVRFAVRRGGV